MQAKPEDTLDVSRMVNDDLASTVSAHPTRFVGLGTLPMNAPLLAVEEMKRAAGETNCTVIISKKLQEEYSSF